MAYGVTDSGFNRKKFTDIKESLEQRARNLFGEDVDLSETSPLMKIINASSLELARLWDSAELIYSSAYIDQATGVNLERIAKLMGIQRSPATYSTGQATFYGDNDTKVPNEFTIATSSGLKFETTESGVIGQETSGEVTLDIKALKTGEDYNVPSNTIDEFVDNKSGVLEVNNDNATTGGEEVETDASLRTRVKSALDVVGNATKTAIENKLLEVDGITSVSVSENDDISIDIIIGGLGSKDELSEEVKEEVDDTINSVRAYGIPYYWDTPTHITINVGGGETEDEYSLSVSGDATNPSNLFDNDTSSNVTYDSTDEYVEIDLGEETTITGYRYYGNTNHNGDGDYKIQYYDGSSWNDLVTDITTRDDSWSDWKEVEYNVTQNIRIVATTLDSDGENEPAEFELELGSTTVVTEDNYPDDAETQIKDAIYDYINSLDVSDDVVYTKLYDVIFNVGDWVYNIEDLRIGDLDSGSLGNSIISIGSTEKASTTFDDIYIDLRTKA